MTQSSTLHPGVLRRFIIDTSKCKLKVGDYVQPGTSIGNDPETGTAIQASISGQVAAIYASHQDTMLIFIRDTAS